MTFPIRFLSCNLILILLLGLILGFKRIFRKQLTVSSQYYIWYIFLLALLVPFLPWKIFHPSRFLVRLQSLFYTQSSNVINGSARQTSGAVSSAGADLTDHAVSAGGNIPFTADLVLGVLWTAGCLITMLYFFCSIYRIYRIRRSAYAVTSENEPELYGEYLSCREELNIRRDVALYASCSISSPVSYGLIRPTVIIPQDMDILLPGQDIHFIFLHELQHYKHKDALLNNISCILQILYWFNPLIWYAFSIMRRDREIACDHSVIRTSGTERAADYGCTLIRFAEKMQKNAFLSPLSQLGGEKTVIFRRIREIADYRPETAGRRFKSVCILLLAALLVYAASPFLTAYAFDSSTYDLSGKTAEDKDLSSWFDGKKGCFVLYDMTNDRYQIYNEEMSTERISPDSTFKIYSALFALEEGVITPDSNRMAWDGTYRYFDSWNQDQSLISAMQNSVNWYFQALDRQSGQAVLSERYREIGYGNCDLSSSIENYWAEGSLKISPAEQVILLSDLLNNRWEFDEENIQAVKDALFIADIPAGKLYGKTGTGEENGVNVNGWFVGFLEHSGHTYCFAANLRDCEDASGSAAAGITMDILNDMF